MSRQFSFDVMLLIAGVGLSNDQASLSSDVSDDEELDGPKLCMGSVFSTARLGELLAIRSPLLHYSHIFVNQNNFQRVAQFKRRPRHVPLRWSFAIDAFLSSTVFFIANLCNDQVKPSCDVGEMLLRSFFVKSIMV
jgi:hypothetical protein